MEVRLDKWLQVARLFKTRSQATAACTAGRVRVGGQPAKPHRRVEVGDRVEVEKGDWTRVVVVRELADRPVAKERAAQLFEDQSPPRPEPDPMERLMRRRPVLRDKGAGRPTKRERRQIDRLREG
ncbi:MAG TPA: RNA-binding S4 domain-containing protein [Thermoanaerobaculia bacterium]|nr:RNA-binding S4 domain-containing protein [Thermoanaerobaculia bacterium]